MPLTDDTQLDTVAHRRIGPLLRVAGIALLGMLAIAALGFAFGAGMAIFEDGEASWRDLGLLAVALLASMASAYFAWRLARMGGEPVARSVRSANRLTWISLITGAALGIVMAAGSGLLGAEFDLYSNAPVSPAIAAIAVIAWLVAVPLITWRWYLSIDEHALEAYNFGALAALHLYFIVAPVWWFGWRGGFLPAPDTMLLYAAVLIVWCLAWVWRRYR